MQVLTVVAQKGGTGKTTITTSLAVAGARNKLSTAVVDLDPQASACRWWDRREPDDVSVVSAQPSRLEQVLDTARKEGAEFVLIDTPPRAEQSCLAAVKHASLVVIPCRPAIYDLETVPTTLELVKFAGNPPSFIVLNGVPPRGTKRADAESILRRQNLVVCPVALGYRAAFDHAGTMGLSAQEYEPRGKASSEIEGVYEFMRSQLNFSLGKE